MALNGFVDDSGSGEGKDRGNLFVLAGFVACPKQWERFSHKWQTICDREPKTPDFKMQTAIRLFREDGSVIWTQAQRDARIKRLVRLTKRKALYRAESVLAWRPTMIVSSKAKRYRKSTAHIFFVSTISSCLSLRSWTRLTSRERWIGCSMTKVASGKTLSSGTSS